METKFTPGPWEALQRDYPGLEDSIIGGCGSVKSQTNTGTPYTVCQLCDVAPEEELRANANLIAAAPELYAALEHALRAVQLLPQDTLGEVEDTPDQKGWYIRDELAHKMGRALAKARGDL